MNAFRGNGYQIRDVSVVDVVHGCTHPGMTVTLSEGIIQSVTQPGDALPQGEYQPIDGRGLYLMPGLIDAHVHYFDPESFGPLLLRHGIVLVRDMGSPTEQVLALREALGNGSLTGPDLITTGWILDGQPPQIPPISQACATPQEGRELVRRQVQAGVDQIKVYSDLEREVFLAIIDEARLQGIQVVGHVPEAVSIDEAARVGLRSSEHLFGFEKLIGRLAGEDIPIRKGGMGAYAPSWLRLPEIDREELQRALQPVRESGMVVCPTVVVMRSRSRAGEIFDGTYPGLDLVSPMIRSIWNMFLTPDAADIPLAGQIWRQMLAFVHELYLAGVPLITGTDLTIPGIIPGASLHEEMQLWQEAGIPPLDVLRSATIIPARFFGMEDSLGSVEPGKKASLVLVRGNPLQDIRNAGDIAGVLLRGQPVAPFPA